MAKKQGVADRSRSKKISESGTQSKKNPNASRGAARIHDDEELETAVVPSSSTESENGDVSGSEDGGVDLLPEEQVSDTDGEEEEEEEEEAENLGIQSRSDTEEEEVEAERNAYGNRQRKGDKLVENPSSKKAKSNAGTSQRSKKDKNSKVMAKEKGGVAAKQGKATKNEEKKTKEKKNGGKVQEKRSEGKKEMKNAKNCGKTASVVNNGVKDNKQKGSQKSQVEESKGKAKITEKKEKPNGNSTHGKKIDEEKRQKRKNKQEEDEEVRRKLTKKVKVSSGDKDSMIKKKGKLEEEDEDSREKVVAKKFKSNGQSSQLKKDKLDYKMSKQTKKAETGKQDRGHEKKVENGAKRGADANRKSTNIVSGKRKMMEEEEVVGDDDDVKCESVLYKFPMSRISRMIKSENSKIKMSQEATFVINKATEKFLELFCKEAYACAFLDRKPHVGYNHLSSVVSKRQRFDFLSDYVPEKIKAQDALADAEKVS